MQGLTALCNRLKPGPEACRFLKEQDGYCYLANRAIIREHPVGRLAAAFECPNVEASGLRDRARDTALIGR
jgi:hypothetical protein